MERANGANVSNEILTMGRVSARRKRSIKVGSLKFEIPQLFIVYRRKMCVL